MHLHYCNQHRIVNLYALHRMSYHQPPPFLMSSKAFCAQSKSFLNQPDFSICQIKRESQTATRRYRAGANIPELNQHLSGVTKIFILPPKFSQSLKRNLTIRVIFAGSPDENIGVNQESHQSWSK
ncbi:MAG: hypothetical protein U0Z53_21605 [Blastocatellia bacterium]